ncbi:MAG: LysM peptidoglycan-binding domain-containing protein [Deltaproteobacteria bacterium]|nr:LysM peptidoglycan-binding domain-containing protein [Deltaproteobacteria bacterium]
MNRIRKNIIVCALSAIVLSPLHAFALNKIINIRHWTAPDHTRVVIDASDDIPYTVEKSGKIVRIDFKNTQLPEDLPRELVLKKPGIDKIILEVPSQDAVRVQLMLTDPVAAKVFKLKKIQEKPDRIVIDIEFPEVEKQESKEREQVKVLRKDKIVVIDPGHGGEDPGAVGKRGTQEKRVVLEISRKLRDILNKKKGYRAFLTRNGDYYVPFKKRLKIAREYGADLFLSIHADAFKLRGARGSSVYCLSLRGASSEAARILARNENLADIIGGDPNGESTEESDPIILNMFQTNTINTSKIYGKSVLKHLDRVSQIKFGKVQEAPFRVLKLPEIPSLLIETAYISNPREEKLLRNNQFQMKVARAIASSITEFLPAQPPAPKIVLTRTEKGGDAEKSTAEAVKDDDSPRKEYVVSFSREKSPSTKKSAVTTHTVRKGETLGGIAREHGTTINVLLKLNDMKRKDPLYVGKKVKLPGKETEKGRNAKSSVAKSKTYTYRVKKGDTLDKIAKRCGASVTELCRLNQMKRDDVLYVNRKLRLPSDPSM